MTESQSIADARPEMSETARRGALLTVFLVVFIDLLGFGIVLPQQPLIAKAMLTPLLPGDVTDAKDTGPVMQLPGGVAAPLRGIVLGALFASFSGMQFLFAPAWGRLSDRIGRRPVLLVGLGGSVVFYTLFGLGVSVGTGEHKLLGLILLFVARTGAGIAGATIATAQAVIADVTTPATRSRGMALIGAAFGIGFTFGPALGGLVGYLAPQWPGLIGYLAACLSFIAFAIAWLRFSETLAPGNAAKAERSHSLTRLIAALREPRIGLLVLTFFLATFAFANFETTLALLNQSLGFDEKENYLVFAAVGAILIVAAGGVYRRLAIKVSESSLLMWGIAFMALGLAIIGAIAYGAIRPGEPGRGLLLVAFFAALTFTVTGYSFLNPSVQSLISKRSDPARQGEFLGVNQSAAALARVVGPAAGPFLFELGNRHVLPYAVAAGLLLVVLGLTPRLRES